MEFLYPAFELLASPAVFFAIVGGVVFGLIVGALPGLGSVLAITIALPFTFSLGIMPF